MFCALIGLYNFGKQCGEDSEFTNEVVDVTDIQISDIDQIETLGSRQMDKMRDELAEKMWKDYQLYIGAI